jgi:predicted dehydrogenase
MNLGIVGVGPWGRTVAGSFERAGTKILAYDRGDKSKRMNNLGDLVSWQEMVESSSFDVVACAATPDVTMQVFEACQKKRKPCFLTKPFLISEAPKDLTAPVYVDYVNLASPIYEKFKKSATRDYKIESLEISFHGNGPERSFTGLLDYGSHAVAFVHDLLGLGPLEDMKIMDVYKPLGSNRELVQVEAKMKGVRIELCTGNGSHGAKRRIEAQLARGPQVAYDELNRVATFEINNKLAARTPGHDPLSIMVERFLWDVEVGRVNPYFVELSVSVNRSLGLIRSAI